MNEGNAGTGGAGPRGCRGVAPAAICREPHGSPRAGTLQLSGLSLPARELAIMLGHGRARAPRARLAEHLATMAGGIALAWARETVRRAQDVKRARAACESARAHGRPEGTAIERLGRALRRLDEASEAADAWAREYGATAAALSGELLAARRRRGTAP